MKKPYQRDGIHAVWWKTALFWFGITLLLTLIPEIYSMFATPAARVFSLLIMILVVIVLVVFLLRNLFFRVHGDNPYGDDLRLTVIVSLLGFAAAFIIAVVLTALLLFAFHVELSPQPGFGAETIVAMIMGAILFAPLFCLPMAALCVIQYHRGFWQVYGQFLKKRGLILFGIAVLCLTVSALIGAFIPGVVGVILTALISAGLLIGSGELIIRSD